MKFIEMNGNTFMKMLDPSEVSPAPAFAAGLAVGCKNSFRTGLAPHWARWGAHRRGFGGGRGPILSSVAVWPLQFARPGAACRTQWGWSHWGRRGVSRDGRSLHVS